MSRLRFGGLSGTPEEERRYADPHATIPWHSSAPTLKHGHRPPQPAGQPVSGQDSYTLPDHFIKSYVLNYELF